MIIGSNDLIDNLSDDQSLGLLLRHISTQKIIIFLKQKIYSNNHITMNFFFCDTIKNGYIPVIFISIGLIIVIVKIIMLIHYIYFF